MCEKIYKSIPNLIRAALTGDERAVEISAINLVRKIKKEFPEISNEISEIITTYQSGASLTRSMGVTPPPTDNDSFMSLIKIEQPDFEEKVILEDRTNDVINRFIRERGLSQKLIAKGLTPPNSILLFGPPGVGKTMVTKHLASKLELPLLTLDLSSTISSYLGKTGQNIKKVLDYAKSNPSVLLLDEFDAVAKRRDDPSDLGELKRIVNVLLKELEEWPPNSIVVAATNYPNSLDKAIWRRFGVKIEMLLPNAETRLLLWEEYLIKNESRINKGLLNIINSVKEISPSDIKQISEKVLRRVIVDDEDPNLVLIQEMKEHFDGRNGEFNKLMISHIKNDYGKKYTQAQIAELLGISTSTVNHHLKSMKRIGEGDFNG